MTDLHSRALAAGLCLAAALTLSPLGALAQSPAARDLVRQGFEARRVQHDADALDLFRRAEALEPSAMVRAQIALAELALGHWRDADAHLREALATTADPWIARNLDGLRAALSRVDEHLGTLEIYGGVDGAQVSVDGESVGVLPLAAPLRWPVGRVTVRVSAEGYAPVERATVIHPGELTRESVAQRAVEPVPAPVVAPPPLVAPTVMAVPVLVMRDRPVRRPRPRSWTERVGAGPWVLVGSGALLWAAAAPLLVWQRDAAGDDLRALGCTLDATGDAFRCSGNGDAATSVHERGATYNALANAAWITGATMTTAGVAWLIARATGSDPSTTVGCSSRGCSLAVRF